jgi:hypothetical protein
MAVWKSLYRKPLVRIMSQNPYVMLRTMTLIVSLQRRGEREERGTTTLQACRSGP